jgi:hypothetical protein
VFVDLIFRPKSGTVLQILDRRITGDYHLTILQELVNMDIIEKLTLSSLEMEFEILSITNWPVKISTLSIGVKL